MIHVGVSKYDNEHRKFFFDDDISFLGENPTKVQIQYMDNDEIGYISLDSIEVIELDKKNINPKIEYRVFDFGHMANEKLEHILNKYGDKGWDMCGFNVYQNLPLSNDLRALSIFKRIKP